MDFGTFAKNLDPEQLKYSATDVVHLHKIHEELNKILVRENRIELYKEAIKYAQEAIIVSKKYNLLHEVEENEEKIKTWRKLWSIKQVTNMFFDSSLIANDKLKGFLENTQMFSITVK